MKRNLLIYIVLSGLMVVNSLPIQAQNDIEVVSEDGDEQSFSYTDKVTFLRHGQSERYAWKSSSSSASNYNSQGKAYDISHIKTIRRYVEPVVHDVSDPEASGINVLSIESDGTMAIEASEEKVPKVGDIICSGPTESFPHGYMLRVTDVSKSSEVRSTRSWGDDLKIWKFVIKTTAAALNEVLSNFHYSEHVDFNDIQIDQVTDNEGHSLEAIEETQKVWKFPISLDLGPNLTITTEITIAPKDLVLYIDIVNKQFQKFGIDFDFDIDLSLQIDAKLDSKYEKNIPLFNIILNPIPICAEPPVVVTPLFHVYLNLKADGLINLSFVPIRSSYEVHSGAYYDFQQEKIVPNIGDDFYTITEKKENKKDVYKLEGGLAFNGSVSASIGASCSWGIDGCNYIGRLKNLPQKLDVVKDMCTIDLRYDVNRVISTKVGLDNINTDAWDDYHFSDECKTENYGQAHLQFFFRIWNPFKKDFVGVDKELKGVAAHFWDDDLFPSLFVPDYQHLTAKLSNGNVLLHAVKYKPYFWNTLFKEENFGFRYRKNYNSDREMPEWKDVSASNVIGNEDDPLWHFDGVIPFNDLEKGCIYYVCPYSYGLTPAGTYNYLHRKGLYLRVDDNGTITFNELPDIPGVDL